MAPREICKKYKVSKQAVSYWKNHEVKETHARKEKLPEKYQQILVDTAQDQLISKYSSKKLARIMNNRLAIDGITNKEGNPLKISSATINRYLNKILGKPRKIRKVFFLSEEQKKKVEIL